MNSPGSHFLPFRNSLHLSQPEAYGLMQTMLSGEANTDEIVELLKFFKRKGETVNELVGFAQAVRDLGQRIDVDQSEQPLVDTCGTGGDSSDTFNVSTATAFVVAGAGVRVAKHGNRKISSNCGSADVLEALGVRIDSNPDYLAECIAQTGIGFLYAPLLHQAVRHAQEARLALKGRTIFNLLGPLTSPVRAQRQLIGAFSVRAAEILAQASARLGLERAFVVHGLDGLDEITTTTHTVVFQVEHGKVQKGRWTPSDFGVRQASPEDLKGGAPETNAEIIRSVLDNQPGPHRDIVVANAAAALLLAQHAEDLKTAVELAAKSIESGSAKNKLEQLVAFTQSTHHLSQTY
jgi:anthranilate phosphoribosyltransferase